MDKLQIIVNSRSTGTDRDAPTILINVHMAQYGLISIVFPIVHAPMGTI